MKGLIVEHLVEGFTDEEKRFCELMGNTIRSQIVTYLRRGDPIRIRDIICKINTTGKTASRNTLNNHLTELKKQGFIEFRPYNAEEAYFSDTGLKHPHWNHWIMVEDA
tara:strand:- start:2803 stop:3126 length:324 start_codon:yes stop_codon:yes gene_type:complete